MNKFIGIIFLFGFTVANAGSDPIFTNNDDFKLYLEKLREFNLQKKVELERLSNQNQLRKAIQSAGFGSGQIQSANGQSGSNKNNESDLDNQEDDLEFKAAIEESEQKELEIAKTNEEAISSL